MKKCAVHKVCHFQKCILKERNDRWAGSGRHKEEMEMNHLCSEEDDPYHQ